MPIYYKKVNETTSTNESGFRENKNRFGFDELKSKLNFSNINISSSQNNFGFASSSQEDASTSLLTGENYFHANSNLTFGQGHFEPLITKYGSILVVKQGSDQLKNVILTYHDIGLNSYSNFESFFTNPSAQFLMQTFCVIHVNAPGQEPNAFNLPNVYSFPTMDQLAEQIIDVCDHFKINSFYGFGFGAGANVLSRFALRCPEKVEGLFLINCSATTSTWSEWFYQKKNIRQLINAQNNFKMLSPAVKDYLLWNLFGDVNFPERQINTEAVDIYKKYFNSNMVNTHNLALFIESYINRTNLNLCRNSLTENFKCNVLVMSGSYSPLLEESVKMNSRLNPNNSTWINLSDCGMVLEEQPNKVAEAFKLFLQGFGYRFKSSERTNTSTSTMGKSLPCINTTDNDLSAKHLSTFNINF